MGWSLQHRIREPEWMDEPGADPGQLRRSLAFIRAINHWLRYTQATLAHLDAFSKSWEKGRTIRILDVATGSGDVPRAVLKWGDKKGFDLRLVGVDLHAKTAREAAAETHDPRLKIVRADALALPFADGAFDYAMTSMFLHHLDEHQIVQVLREMNRVARRGILVADLLRQWQAIFWIKAFTLFANPMLRHDAVVSVKQSFRKEEILALTQQAGAGYLRFQTHFGHRFVLAGEKAEQ